MTKAVSFSLGFFILFAVSNPLRAQVSPADLAVNKAIENQADTITLRQKIVDARAAEDRGDLAGAAKLYDSAYELTQKIGSGIDVETAQTVAGLVHVRMALAKQAQANGDYLGAETQVARVLKVAPQDSAALEFKQKNDNILEATKGMRPDIDTLSKIPDIEKNKQDAGTLVQDGKLLYEAGKFEEAQVKLQQALQLDPDSQAAFYYLNLTKQEFYQREENNRVNETHDKMLEVQKEWVPKLGINLPVPNPYATNTDIHTSAQRDKIYEKLSSERLDNIPWGDGLPLSEAMTYLRDQSKIRDPEQKGVNFLFNPNQESAGTADTGGAGAAQQINPQTGLPQAAPTGGGGGGETVDPSTITIKLALSDVTLQDALDAIVLVADRPIKYSVGDFGVIFSTKPSGPEPPELQMRTFRVDPNTFYQGLQSVSSFTFGAANNNSGGNGGNGGGGNSGGGGGNNGGGNNGGGNGSSVSGAIVPVVNIAGGGGGNGGRGGGGGNGGGVGGGGGNGGGVGGGGGGGGIDYLTRPGNMSDVSAAARDFFVAIGVNLAAPGRSIAFNDRLGLLFVKASPSELDAVERTIHALNQVAPQVHIKARFIEVSQNDSAALGFDTYLGNFINGKVIANGGSAPSLTVPVSAANPLGAFPGNTLANIIPPSSTDQQVSSGLGNGSIPTIATVTGILTDPNFRIVLHALETRSGVETLAEPEVVTTSGRQTQMRATDIEYILTGFSFQAGNTGTTTGGGNGIP